MSFNDDVFEKTMERALKGKASPIELISSFKKDNICPIEPETNNEGDNIE